jgi:AraC-like DNA-binding protein
MASFDYPKVYLYRRIVQAKLFMDGHYHEPIDLDNIADEAYFSKFHFIRLFRKTYGKTPHQYLTGVRIEKARELLLTEVPVADVCYAVGFESTSSFTGLFRRLVGLTPSAYQEAQRKLRAEIKAAPLKFIPNCFAEKKGWTKKSNFEEGNE